MGSSISEERRCGLRLTELSSGLWPAMRKLRLLLRSVQARDACIGGGAGEELRRTPSSPQTKSLTAAFLQISQGRRSGVDAVARRVRFRRKLETESCRAGKWLCCIDVVMFRLELMAACRFLIRSTRKSAGHASGTTRQRKSSAPILVRYRLDKRNQ